MSRLTANFLLLLAGAIWGGTFVAQQTAMEHVGPFSFVAMRFIIACAVIAPFALLECRRPKEELPPMSFTFAAQFVLVGLTLFSGMAAQQVGLLTITVTSSGFLTGLYVIFTPFLAVLLFRQWPHPIVWPATVLAMMGIFFLSGGNLASLQKGDLLTVLGAAFWALQVVLIARWVGRSKRPLTLSFYQFAVTALMAGIVAFLFETLTLDDVRAAIGEILFSGVFATGLAFSIQVSAQRYTTAPQAAIFLSSESLFAAMFGALLLGERIGTLGLFGCGLIFTAMLLVEVWPLVFKSKLREPAI